MDNPSTLKPLTSIRGLAALWVYLYHRSNLATDNAFVSAFMKDGYFGLDVFFVLSGFIISHVHQDDFRNPRDIRRNTGFFLWLRLFRIYPLYLGILMLFVFFQKAGGGPRDLFQHMLLMQSWGWSNNEIWNIPDWSISVEWLIYLLFPLLALAAAFAGAGISGLALTGGAFALFALYSFDTNRNVHDMVEPFWCLPRGICDFAIGMGLQNLYRRKILEKLPWDIVAVLAFAGFFIIPFLKSKSIYPHDLAYIALSAVLIFALANLKSWGHYIFSNRAAVYLGTISYSMYLLQWIYMLLAAKYRGVTYDGKPLADWHILAETLGWLALSALSYHIIENPCRKYGRVLLEEERQNAAQEN